MPTLTRRQAERSGYIVDKTCYPWVAYKGPRFDPTESAYVLTDIEAKALRENRKLKRLLKRAGLSCG